MPGTKQSGSKRNHNKFQEYLWITVCVLAIALSPLLIYSFINPSKLDTSELAAKATVNLAARAETNSDLKTEEPDITEVTDASSEMGGKWLGLCKKNSIHSVKDFQRTIQNDEVLSSHYSGFDWKNARLGKQNEEILAFVSHRKGDVIKKTSKPIKLPKGDGYITDGTHTARTFCCNDIILTPSAGPPPEKGIFPESAGFPPPDIYLLPEFYPLPDGSPRRKIYHPPIRDSHSEPVPEPATLILFGTGLVVLVAVRLRKNSANKHRE